MIKPNEPANHTIQYRPTRRERLSVWWRNASNAPSRWMAHYLQRRGWVVFYLEPITRYCSKQTCWLRIYQNVTSHVNGPEETTQ